MSAWGKANGIKDDSIVRLPFLPSLSIGVPFLPGANEGVWSIADMFRDLALPLRLRHRILEEVWLDSG